MVNVLVISELFWPEGSGGELATYLYLKNIKDINITLLTGTSIKQIPKDIVNKKNIEIVTVPWLKKKHRLSLWFELLRNEHFIKKIISKHDVVYITREALPIVKYVKDVDTSIKTIYHLHGYMPLSYNSIAIAPYEETRKKIFKYSVYIAYKNGLSYGIAATIFGKPITWYVRNLLKYIDIIICVSKRHKEIILKSIPNIKDKVIYIYNPIPEDILINEKKLDTTPTYIYVGGDSFIKGFNQLLHVLQYLITKKIDFKIYLTNKYTKRALKALETLNASHKIKVLGRIPRKKMQELYKKSWALIFPSIYEEPLPYAVLESMITGTIPLASRVGGVPELLGKDLSMFLFNPYSIKDIVKKILFVYKMEIVEIKYLSDKSRRYILDMIKTHNPIKRLTTLFEM